MDQELPSLPDGCFIGGRCVIQGLSSAVGRDLNGRIAILTAVDHTTGRLCLQLGNDDLPAAWKKVKAEYIRSVFDNDEFHRLAITRVFGTSAPAAVELRQLEGKGYGVIATRDFAAGSVILEEPWLFAINERDCRPCETRAGYASMWTANVQKCVDTLSVADRSLFVSLPDRGCTLYHTIDANIAAANRWESGRDIGICPLVSMVNHSCCPSSRITRGTATNTCRVIALKGITRGEEICVSYTNEADFILAETRSRREAFTDTNGFIWHFKCTCEVCQRNDPDSNRRRQDLHSLFDRADRELTRLIHDVGVACIPSDDGFVSGHVLIGIVQKLSWSVADSETAWDLLRREGLCFPDAESVFVLLGAICAYYDCGAIAERRKSSLMWLERGWDLDCVLKGAESVEAMAWSEDMKSLRSAEGGPMHRFMLAMENSLD